LSKLFNKKQKQNNQGLFKNPLFYFGLVALLLWGMPFFSFGSLTELNNFKNEDLAMLNPFFKDINSLKNNDLFFSQSNQLTRESPDLKIIQNNFVYGISTPRILTTQTLGDILGESPQNKKEVIDHTIETGDTIESVAKTFGISITTLLLANDLSKNSSLKVGQTLIILPVDGILHIVRSGDTVSSISQKYKAKSDDIISFNNLANEGDIFVGDVLIIPGGIMPAKPLPSTQVQLPNSFFIYPAEGKITQGLHYYNGVDVGNQCGTPVHSAASGVVQRVRYDYRYGNYVTVLHSNGVVTYYGHLQTIFVKSGDRVNVGDRIALMGRTGTYATGCHVHFQVMGAANPLAKYFLGTNLKYQ